MRIRFNRLLFGFSFGISNKLQIERSRIAEMAYYGNRLMGEEDIEDSFVSIEDPNLVLADYGKTLQRCS